MPPAAPSRRPARAAVTAAESTAGEAPPMDAAVAARCDARPQIRRRSGRRAVVAELQRRLNQIHEHQRAAEAPGLADCPLAVDSIFGRRTQAAVVSFQRLAFPGEPRAWDGIVGPNTWAALDRFTTTPLPVPPVLPIPPILPVPPVLPIPPILPVPPILPIPPVTPPGPTPGVVTAGREVIATVHMLQAHVGTPPDLILRWNRMASVPAAVDVVVHLHGFSPRGAAMRLDVDKEPASGLDFEDPDPPGEPGRAEPTLCILPRGNYYGGQSGMGYNFPALVAPGGLDQLIGLALSYLAARLGAARMDMRRLVLTAHSGGGAPLMRILGSRDPDEVHVFDGTYSDAAPLVRWATARLARPDAGAAALRVLYIAGTGTAAQSRLVDQALAGLLPAGDARARRFRVEATRVAHNDMPRRFGWRLLRDAGADLPLSGGQAPGPPRPGPPTPPSPPGPIREASLTQAEVDRLAAITFGNAAEINAFFARGGAAGFTDWFNANVGGRAPFVRPGGGGAMRMPTSADARARFDGFWDSLALAYDQPRISALEFAALMCITLNETSGDFSSRVESSGSGGGGRTDARGRHPGLAYFFDRIELRPGRWKASYNQLTGGRTTGSLFDDEVYVRAHGALGGAAALAHRGSAFNGAWMSEYYPQDRFSTDERAAETGFIRQADFYKFRGRGVIQTTGRAGYAPFVRFVQGYAGADAALLERHRRWSGMPPDDAASASTNEDWDAIFASPDTLARALAFHANPDGRGLSDYRFMSRDAALLADTPPPVGGRTPAGRKGSVYYMGRRISGSYAYAADEYSKRVVALLGAILQAAPDAPLPSPPGPAPTPPQPTPTPTPSALGDAIVRIAEQEYRRWHPATGSLRETDSAAVPILQQYYREALNRNIGAAELQDAAWQQQHPWSAVFISWVMRTAGAGTGFAYAAAHQEYIRAARRNRLEGVSGSPFWAYRATEVVPEVGDLVCASRANSGATYDNIADPQARATHCDVVTEVRPGALRVIGGNVNQNVDAKTIRTLPDGHLSLDRDQARIFAVVRCRGPAAGHDP